MTKAEPGGRAVAAWPRAKSSQQVVECYSVARQAPKKAHRLPTAPRSALKNVPDRLLASHHSHRAIGISSGRRAQEFPTSEYGRKCLFDYAGCETGAGRCRERSQIGRAHV